MPPGLRDLSFAQENLAAYLDLDDAFLQAAAELSEPLPREHISAQDTLAWAQGLPHKELAQIVASLVEGDGDHTVSQLRRARRKALQGAGKAPQVFTSAREIGRKIAQKLKAG